MPVKLTQEQAEQNIINFNSEYRLISEYISARKPVSLQHKCGKQYKIGRYKSFLEGKNKCPICYPSQSNAGHSTKRVSEEDMINRLKEQLGEEYTYIKGYTKMSEKTSIIRHNTCGTEFLVAPKMMLGIKQTRCPECSNKKRGSHLRDDNYLENILSTQVYGKDYEWLEEYNGDNKEKLKILHKTCNRNYSVRPNGFQQGYQCPHCQKEMSESYNSKLIRTILENNNNIDYKTEVTFDNLTNKRKLKMDFLIENNIILEYDGEQHFRPTFSMEEFIKGKERDIIKNNWIMNSDYYFVRIPYTLKDINITNIINELIKNNKLSIDTISKYNLYVYDNFTGSLYNSKSYYTKINKDYFNI